MRRILHRSKRGGENKFRVFSFRVFSSRVFSSRVSKGIYFAVYLRGHILDQACLYVFIKMDVPWRSTYIDHKYTCPKAKCLGRVLGLKRRTA